ncbi:MAG: hypothetical protein Q8Q22_02360 [bacterium]|nr:hypothetical protein [bacterium]MDZ4206078.1 hypothetical protein [Patescibacteria group bacterium]
MKNKTRTISYDQRVRFFWALVAISMLSLFIYIYAVNATARNIAIRQDLEKQMANMSANLNSLEFAYIELRNNITIELAYDHGFREAKSPLYVSRARPASLSFNTLSR